MHYMSTKKIVAIDLAILLAVLVFAVSVGCTKHKAPASPPLTDWARAVALANHSGTVRLELKDVVAQNGDLIDIYLQEGGKRTYITSVGLYGSAKASFAIDIGWVFKGLKQPPGNDTKIVLRGLKTKQPEVGNIAITLIPAKEE